MPVTLTENEQDPFTASDAPVSAMLEDPATAVIVPLQPFGLLIMLLGVDTTNPEGKLSVKLTPVIAGFPLGLPIVNVNAVL